MYLELQYRQKQTLKYAEKSKANSMTDLILIKKDMIKCIILYEDGDKTWKGHL